MSEEGDEIDLIENGHEIPVTKENIEEYCVKAAKYYLITQVKEEVREFLKGFYSVVPRSVIRIFDEDELDFLLEGVQDINLDDWKEHTLYKGEFS
jgi:E3 ubiquitin-protein ligase HUWE1